MSQDEWHTDPVKNGPQYLSTVFLANRSRVNKQRRSLAYSVALGVRVPDYEIDRKLWINEHYEGGYLFRNAILLEMVPPASADEAWTIHYAWQNQGTAIADQKIDTEGLCEGKIEVSIPFDSDTTPGMSGNLRFVVTAWNGCAWSITTAN